MSVGSFVAQLEERQSAGRLGIAYGWDRLFAAADARERFVRYMVEMYHYVRWSCPTMARAAARLEPRHVRVRDYLHAHIEEEAGHDAWVLDDLAALGLDRGAVKRGLPTRQTLALVSSQFYMIDVVSPVAYLGYVYALESRPPTHDSLDALADRLRLPREALSALRAHAMSDPAHLADLRALLDSDVLDPDDRALVEFNLVATVENLSDLVLAVAS